MDTSDSDHILGRGTFNGLARGVKGRDRNVEKADTPFGKYRITGVDYGRKISSAYGTGKINLDPVSGEVKDSGRTLIRIHGGGTGLPDSYAARQELIATWGCVRVANADAETISELLEAMGFGGDDYVYVGTDQYLKSLSLTDSNLRLALQKEGKSTFEEQIRIGFQRLINELNLRRLQDEGRGSAESKICFGSGCPQ